MTTIYGHNTPDTLTGTPGDDVIYGWDAANAPGDEGPSDDNDWLSGGAGDNVLYGGAGNDRLDGGTGRDTLIGGSGDDYLDGFFGGGDEMYGGSGNDIVELNDFSGFIDGGLDIDIISIYSNLNINDIYIINVENLFLNYNRIIANASQLQGFSTISNSYFNDPSLVEIELSSSGIVDLTYQLLGRDVYFTGSSGNDTITTSDGDDTIDGGAGNDIVYGAAGNDTIYHRDSGADTLNGGAGDDRFFSEGGAAGTINGDSGNDIIVWDGSDTASINGGSGTDSLYAFGQIFGFSHNISNLLITNVEILYIRYGITATPAQLNNFSTIAFSDYDLGREIFISLYSEGSVNLNNQILGRSVVFTGSSGNDTITTSDGDDTITGGLGADTLRGGLGNDILDGGAGLDTADYSDAGAAVSVYLANLAAQNTGGAGVDTLAGIENLTGSAFNDTLFGDDAANSMVGGSGHDVLRGGLGNDGLRGGLGNDVIDGGGGNADTAYYTEAASGVTVNLTLTAQQNTGGAGLDTISDIENIAGSNFADVLTGSIYNNTLAGNAGNDAIDAGAGNDLVRGGAGDDALNGGAGVDTVSYSDATSAVTASLALTTQQATGGGGLDTLLNFENLTGSNFNDALTGDAGNNVLTGGLGNDALNGGTGGVDTAGYAEATAGVTVSLAIAGAQATGGAGTDTLTNIDALIGSAFNDTLTGDGNANQLTGGAGADTLSGGLGSDVLLGGLGNDVMDGGVGASDTASYLDIGAAVTVSLALTTAQNTIGAGTDTLTNFENLIGSGYGDTLSGNAGANIIVGGYGRDVMTGGGGNDRFRLALASETGSIAATSDVITDFNAGDLIDLSLIDANANTAGVNDAFSNAIVSTFTNVAGQLRFTTFADPLAAGGTSGLLSGDIDGNGTADFAITLRNVTTLSATSIVL
jgi:Ca2+-binding RTX toxin-like protein